MKPISTATAAHYTWGAGCDGWHLVKSDHLSVIQEHMPAGTTEVRHQHRKARQFFFVLQGEIAVECAGVTHALSVGRGLEIPPLTPHRTFNDSGAPADFLVISTPPSHQDREPVPAV